MGGVLMKRIFGFLTVAAFAGMLFAANAFARQWQLQLHKRSDCMRAPEQRFNNRWNTVRSD